MTMSNSNQQNDSSNDNESASFGTASPRTRVGHCKRNSTDVYAGRGPGGRAMDETEIGERGWLGNPYPLDEVESRAASIEAFRADFVARLKVDSEFREAVRELAGKTLGCWCQSLEDDHPACHAEVIAEQADRLEEQEATA